MVAELVTSGQSARQKGGVVPEGLEPSAEGNRDADKLRKPGDQSLAGARRLRMCGELVVY